MPDLASTFAVLKPDQSVTLVDVSPTIYEELWEMHPAGDEIVCLLSGDAGVAVPRGTWHTARTRVPTTMLFVSPGQDTQNKPV